MRVSSVSKQPAQLGRNLVLLAALCAPALWAAPSAAISASPTTGNAPLGVFFDGTASLNAATYEWDFGDGGGAVGGMATTATITHIYTVAGTYFATLTVLDAGGIASPPTQITITVNGSGQGVVTSGLNFRVAPYRGSFLVNRTVPNVDKLSLNANFNTVDLPNKLTGLAVSVTLNNSFVVSGNVAADNSVSNPANSTTPSFYIFFDTRNQLVNISISHANLQPALAAAGAIDANISAAAPVKVPITIVLSIGAESYSITEYYDYTAVKGVSGTGTYVLKYLSTPSKLPGGVAEGFFVVGVGSAIEVPFEKAHFFQFTGYLSPSAGGQLVAPPSGSSIVVTLNEAQPILLPFDRFKPQGTPSAPIVYVQQSRAVGAIRTFNINPVTRYFSFTTWDINANATIGGTGLPVRGEAFTSYNFTLRFDIPQPGGTTFSVVTATQLQRKTTDDALWLTGRKNTPN
jgi:PKD repeat protein